MNNKVLVTGAGGSFGINTSKYFLDRGCEVIGIGRNFLRTEPFSLNIDKEKNYKYCPFHITYEIDLLMKFLDQEKPTTIINYASQGEGAVSWENSWRYFETNSMGLSRFVEELSKRDYLEHFINISTSELYGSMDKPAGENCPVSPSSPYAASKLAFDFYLISMNRFKNFPCTIVRPSNCYGPSQLLHRIIPKCIWAGLTSRKIPLHGGGKAQKSYLHIRDLSYALSLIYQNGKPEGKIYNVGPANPTPIREVVERCAAALEIEFEDLCEVTEDRLGQDSRYWLDSSAIAKDYGWYPTTEWNEGLADMVRWGKKYYDQIKDLNPDYVMRA